MLWFLAPYLVAAYIMTLPSHIGYIARILFPGWLASYTPSALLTMLFVHDKGWVKKLWDNSPLGYYDKQWYWRFALIVEVAVIALGYIAVVNQVLFVLTELQTIFTLAMSGNVLGLLMGYLTTRNWDI